MRSSRKGRSFSIRADSFFFSFACLSSFSYSAFSYSLFFVHNSSAYISSSAVFSSNSFLSDSISNLRLPCSVELELDVSGLAEISSGKSRGCAGGSFCCVAFLACFLVVFFFAIVLWRVSFRSEFVPHTVETYVEKSRRPLEFFTCLQKQCCCPRWQRGLHKADHLVEDRIPTR